MQFSEPSSSGGKGGAAASAKREREARKRRKEAEAAVAVLQGWWRRQRLRVEHKKALWGVYTAAVQDCFPEGDVATALKLKPTRVQLPNGAATLRLATLLMRAVPAPQRAEPTAAEQEAVMTVLRLVTLSTARPEEEDAYVAEVKCNLPLWLATTTRLIRHAVRLFDTHLAAKNRVLFGAVLKFVLDVTSLKNWAYLKNVPADVRPKHVQYLMQQVLPPVMDGVHEARFFGVMRDFLSSTLHSPADVDDVLTAGLANICVKVAGSHPAAAADLTRDVLATTACLAQHLSKAVLQQFTHDKRLWDAILTSILQNGAAAAVCVALESPALDSALGTPVGTASPSKAGPSSSPQRTGGESPRQSAAAPAASPTVERTVFLAGNVLQLGRLAGRAHVELRERWSQCVAQLFEAVPQRSEMTRLLDTNAHVTTQLRILWEPETITMLFEGLLSEHGEGPPQVASGGGDGSTAPTPVTASIFNHMRKSSRCRQRPDLTAKSTTVTAVLVIAALAVADTVEPHEVSWAAPKWTSACKLFNGLVYSWDTRSAINSLLSTPYLISALWAHIDQNVRMFEKFAEGTAPEELAQDLGNVLLLLLHCFDNLLAVMDDKEFYTYQRPFTLATVSYMVSLVSKLAFRLSWDGVHPTSEVCVSCNLTQGGAPAAPPQESCGTLNTSCGSAASTAEPLDYTLVQAQQKLTPLQRQRGCVYARLLVLSQGVLRKLHQRETRMSFCPASNWLIAPYKGSKGFHFPDVLKYLNDNIHNNPFENLFGVLRELSSEMLQSSDPLERHFGDIFGNLRNLFSNLNEIYRTPDLDEPSTVSKDEHLLRYQQVIRPLPFLIPYKERLEYLRCLIERDRQAHHASDVKFPVTVRRNTALLEAVREFARLDGAGTMHLKAQLHVKFLNKEGVPEDGIDEGGLFKELLEILTVRAFSPRLGYFTMTEDGRLYPNPRSRTQGGHLQPLRPPLPTETPPDPATPAGGASKAAQALQGGAPPQNGDGPLAPPSLAGERAPAGDMGSPSLWGRVHDDEAAEAAEAEAIREEFPHLKVFKFLGRLLGKAVYEGVVVEIPLAEFFLNTILGQLNYFSDLASQDSEVCRHLDGLKDLDAEAIANLALNFTVYDPAAPTGEHALFPKGEGVAVTAANLPLYLRLVANYKLNVCIAEQSQAFLSGFHEILPPSMLALFDRKELQQLISGLEGSFDILDLRAHTRYEGYTDEHDVAQNFWSVLGDFTDDEKGAFLRFVMSSARPPLLGFGHINPPFMIRRLTAPTDPTDSTPLARLPTSSTCFNLLCLPPYPTRENLRDRLLYAITSGTGFELS
eukprot:TRINITY_DN16536_c0_g1_i1.p1 TRINITY_DN16536_c0_g1~~TRINITY_DN16536_c0_g1_i1.p1  ORF type:complete len:1356 (+),score=488.35 TRINITY_DN16536_c0_g1_i1:122-4069(+)